MHEQVLPESVMKVCKTGIAHIIANATGFVAEMCTHGVNALMNFTNGTCYKGAAVCEKAIKSANASCSTAMDKWDFFGADIVKLILEPPVQTACGTAAQQLDGFPSEVQSNHPCMAALTTHIFIALTQICAKVSKGGEALHGICDGLSAGAKAAGQSAVASIQSSVHSLATDMKTGVVLHVKARLTRMELGAATHTHSTHARTHARTHKHVHVRMHPCTHQRMRDGRSLFRSTSSRKG